jgi:hypothetical protein
MKFQIPQEGIPRLLLSITEGKYLDPEKTRIKKEHQSEAFHLVKYVTLETQVHKHNYKECEEKSERSTKL